MTQKELRDITDELLYFLRNNITDPSGRPSSGTYTATATAGQTVFTISVAGIKNVKTVTVAGSSKSYGSGYSVSLGVSTSVVTLAAGATAGDSVVITYDYGTAWIYDDTPRKDLSLSSFPRIAITDVNSTMTEVSLGATLTRMSMLKSITAYALDSKAVGDLLTDVKNAVLSNKKSFYNFNLIVPVGIGPVLTFTTVEGQKEIVYQAIDVEIPFVWEGTS